MTDLQKRHRIKYLWKVARLIKTYDQMKIRNEAMRELLSEDDEQEILENIQKTSQKQWRWYIIRQENTLPQLWSFIINSLTFYALYSTPFVLVFPESINALRSLENIVDVAFTMDIVLNFFKLSQN